MHTRSKLLSVALMMSVASLPIAAKFDIIGTIPRLIYLVVASNLAIILWIQKVEREPILVASLSGALVAGLFASYQAPLVEGSLFVWDQHITVARLKPIASSGYFPDTWNDSLRGGGVTKVYMMLFAFGSMAMSVLAVDPFFFVKAAPALILPLLPLVGAGLTREGRSYIALLWISPVMFRFSAATTVAQMYALPLFGLVLTGAIILARTGRIGIKMVLVVAMIGITLAHSVTPIAGLLVFAGFAAGGASYWKENTVRTVGLYAAILLGIWLFLEHFLIFGSFVSLFEDGISGLIKYFSDAPLKIEIEQLNEISTGAPRPDSFYIGNFLRFFSVAGIGLLFLVRQRIKGRLKKGIKHPHVASILVGGPPIVGFWIVFGAYDLNRTWLMLTVAASLALGHVASRDYTDVPVADSVAALSLGLGLAIGSIAGYYHLSTAGPLGPQQLVVAGAGVVICLCVAFVVVFVHVKSQDMSRIRDPTISTNSVPHLLILMLVLGHALVGIPLETFSADKRAESFEEPGLTEYHKSWDYSTASFVARYTTPPVVGDSRQFLTEEYYRHKLRPSLRCYVTDCPQSVVVWYDSYRRVWQGIGYVGHIHTRIPDGKTHLSTTRSKVYTTGKSGVYVRA